jgi:hypothetical protein
MFNLGYSVWHASRWPLPAALAPAETLRLAVSYGVLAPSIYNTQPWVFHLDGDTLELRADPTRALPVTDPDYRELTISCGAALMNVRIALRHFGYAADVSLVPDPDQPTLLARVRTGPRAEETDEDRALFFAIERRHTNLGEFEPRPVPDAFLEVLQAAAQHEGAWLRFVTRESDRVALADLISESDCIQGSNPMCRSEQAEWVARERVGAAVGASERAVETSSATSFETAMQREAMAGIEAQAARDVRVVLGSPVVTVLGSNSDGVQDWLVTGQALERVLLRAAAEGVFAYFPNQPIRDPRLRPWLRLVAAHEGAPQLVLCMGYATPPSTTPRRSVGDAMVG